MILHLADDPKFLLGAYNLFEEYYPGQNHFFLQVSRNDDFETKNLTASPRFFYTPFTTLSGKKKIFDYAQKYGIKHVLVHNLTTTKAAIANHLKNLLSVKTYWIFYGADLYRPLNEMGKYQLLDGTNKKKDKLNLDLKRNLSFFFVFRKFPNYSFKHFIKQLDFFCFWNHYDFLLMKDHFSTQAQHKSFAYYHLLNRRVSNVIHKKTIGKILINHSASFNGNHKTIFEKLASLDGGESIKEIITPLSYGDNTVKTEVSSMGEMLFREKYKPLYDFLSLQDYNNILNTISVAIFGNRRQEAGGNVAHLLSTGAKVFLRNDNNMIHWFRDQGFKIFSFEDDLNSFQDLLPLSSDLVQQNILAYAKTFSKEIEIKDMRLLISNS